MLDERITSKPTLPGRAIAIEYISQHFARTEAGDKESRAG